MQLSTHYKNLWEQSLAVLGPTGALQHVCMNALWITSVTSSCGLTIQYGLPCTPVGVNASYSLPFIMLWISNILVKFKVGTLFNNVLDVSLDSLYVITFEK